MAMSEDVSAPADHGDRAAFLARIRGRQGPPPALGPHPPPPPPEVVPELRYRALDGIDHRDPHALVGVFVDAARSAEATVEVVDGAVPAASVADLVAQHGVTTAVVSAEDGLDDVVAALVAAGVEVQAYSPAAAADADLAVTSATHGLASTGTVVVDTSAAGSRAVSLLPRIHLCVLPVERLVATHADVLRSPTAPMPSCRVLITGPSRTGDIEQRLTLGAHGPVALHILLIR